jgi:hypothetical protein
MYGSLINPKFQNTDNKLKLDKLFNKKQNKLKE